jgi:hypothetical protein
VLEVLDVKLRQVMIEKKVALTGPTALATGASSGIGLEIARLPAVGFRVYRRQLENYPASCEP